MSEHTTIFIPQDPGFVPTEQAQQAACALLRKLAPRADDITSGVDDGVTFRDCGSNFESVACPRCHRAIAIETWQGWMSADHDKKRGFRLRPVVTPCCGTATTLNDLVYTWPQGFSRYHLSARNAKRPPSPASIGRLERVLGCKLRTIRQHI